MTAVFADTFYFLALLNPRDEHYASAHALPAPREIVTTRAVLLEVGDAFSDAATRQLAFAFLESLDDSPTMTIVPLDEGLYADGLALYGDRPDKDWSLTDCISFVVMQSRSITTALTGDHHFEQAGFTVLLA